MWTEYFRMKGVRRGRIITPSHGELDFSQDDIPTEICLELFENDFPYLEITPEGKKKFYGIEAETTGPDVEFEPLPPGEDEPDKLKESVPVRPDIPASEPEFATKKKRKRKPE